MSFHFHHPNYTTLNFTFEDTKIEFDIVPSKAIEEPPLIQVTFVNGRKDTFELKHYKLNEQYPSGCNYIGKLRKEPNSVVAVTGCVNRDGDKIEISMISEHNTNKNHQFRVYMKKSKAKKGRAAIHGRHFKGKAVEIPSPFEDGGNYIVIQHS